mmetsp:Transcript_21662/g.37302  ORF Transcript_21662/g.37302 Transcript_21662/m.37302 type:complete len:275 (+) Transcript_21662:139-963(+)
MDRRLAFAATFGIPSATQFTAQHRRCGMHQRGVVYSSKNHRTHISASPSQDGASFESLIPLIFPALNKTSLEVSASSRPPSEEEKNRRARDGEYDEREREREGRKVATLEDPERRFDTVLQELAAIQNDGPRKIAIIGTRHTSYLHQQIIELLTYANILVGNHVITSGAAGTNAAVIRGALRAENPSLLTVVLPQSLHKQPPDTQDQLKKVTNLIEMSENDSMPLSVASQLCNSDIIDRCSHFIAFAFHDSDVVLESAREAKSLNKIVTLLYLD